MTRQEQLIVVDFLKENMDICSPSKKDTKNFNGNILIHNDTISLLDREKRVIQSRQLDSQLLQEQVRTIVFRNNIFLKGCKDVHWSPFEHDRDENAPYIVGGVKKGIDFPKFASVIMATLLLHGQFPDFMDYAKIYALTYTQRVTDADAKIDFSKYLVGFSGEWKDIDKDITYPDGQVIRNRLLRFTDTVWDGGYASDFPFNQFTTEMLFCRLFKAYGSVVRDPYHILRLHSLTKLDTEYSLWSDYGGSDGESMGYSLRAYVDSCGGHSFGYKKVTERHRNLSEKRVELHISITKVSDLKVLSDSTLCALGTHMKQDGGLKIVRS